MNIHPYLRPMMTAVLACAAIAAGPASAADEPMLKRFGTCQESWHDWQEGDPRQAQFVRDVEGRLDRRDDGAAFTPKSPMTVFGLAVSQVYPQSVGMGVGFSMIVDADFAESRRAFEKQLGRPMTCVVSDGLPACELQLGVRKTAVLMTDDPRRKTTLAGCYYFFQQ